LKTFRCRPASFEKPNQFTERNIELDHPSSNLSSFHVRDGTGHAPSNQEQESLWEWLREENSTGERGRLTFHLNCKQTL
jgi:hypothetical protein